MESTTEIEDKETVVDEGYTSSKRLEGLLWKRARSFANNSC